MSAPITTLDELIADAIERARREAIEQTTRRITEQLGQDHEIRRLVFAEVERLVKEDPEVKAKLRESVLRILDEPTRKRGY